MSDSNNALKTELETIKHGLFLMSSVDRGRALSTHETDDLIEALRKNVETALQLAK
ncbi:hypothetical protein [Marinicellulosiphila megalodicopiae]|uniref:hypothetical protein n=1 Tax=Marinicellulosiphila megalodicopiae TaxID=2724896 RepID=UPI003BAE97BD